MDEVAPSSEGYRRFRRAEAGGELVVSLDPVTQLLVGEEASAGGARVTTRHQWKRSGSYFVKKQTDIEDSEMVDGRPVTHRVVLTFDKVHVQ